MNQNVTIIHNGTEFVISRHILALSRTMWNLMNEDDEIRINDEYSDEQFGDFLGYLENGKLEKNIECVLDLSIEWKIHQSLINEILNKKQSFERDGIIICDDKSYPINIGQMIMSSNTYKLFQFGDHCGIFCVPSEFSSVCDVFVRMVHGEITDFSNIEIMSKLLEFAQFMDCNRIQRILERMPIDMKIKYLINEQNMVKTNVIEAEISKNLNIYIKYPEFAQISVPVLIRILTSNSQSISVNDIKDFYLNLLKSHGSSHSYLLWIIDTSLESSDFLQLVGIIKDHVDINALGNIFKIILNQNEEKICFQRKIANLEEENRKLALIHKELHISHEECLVNLKNMKKKHELPKEIILFTSVGESVWEAPITGIIQVLIVAGGGGGGGQYYGGGGGAGGVIYLKEYPVIKGSQYPIRIGNGGKGGKGSNTGENGGDTSFNNLKAFGGGGGGCYCKNNGKSGGSGGGGGGCSSNFKGGDTIQENPQNAISYGNSGGDGNKQPNPQASGYKGGGGGGAGGKGSTPPETDSVAGQGGPGIDFSKEFGQNFGVNGVVAGGGGGGGYIIGISKGGIGGGGNGGHMTNGVNAVPSTGSGGGGCDGHNGIEGGNGASGLVIIKYLDVT